MIARPPTSMLAALFLLCAISACERTSTQPAILVVSIDTLRRDHVSAYGHDRETTPELDALAREGALFENAVSTSNWTLPAHMSLLTGLGPSSHQVEDERDRLAPELHTLAGELQEAGFATAGFASHVYLAGRYGFARGFDVYGVVADRRAQAVSDRALAWLERHGAGRFFLFLHYFDPHWDYAPPPPFDRRFGPARRGLGSLGALFQYHALDRPMPEAVRRQVLNLYDGEIAYADAQIGRVVEWLRRRGRLEHTVVAVVSDHGEEFGEHESFGHGTHLHGEVTRIPLIVRHPRIAPGTRRGEVVTLSDLPATLLDLAGVEPSPQFLREGAALFGAGIQESDGRSLVVESTRQGPKRFALYRGSYVLLSAARFQPLMFTRRNGEVVPVKVDPLNLAPALHELNEDPDEQHDLLGEPDARPIAAELGAALRRFAIANARGLLLLCTAEVEVRVEGTLRLALPPFDEPYPLPGQAPARVDPLGHARYRLALHPGPAEAGVVLPLARGSQGVSLFLGAPGVEGPVAYLPRPLAGGSLPVPVSGSAAVCRIEVGRAAPGTHKQSVEIPPEEREKLRALGYIE